ncbi:MAG: cytochrome c [Deltaproteobacteria bacterium]|nr:cytochrome c [Deltaproteobacteria bacterium]
MPSRLALPAVAVVLLVVAVAARAATTWPTRRQDDVTEGRIVYERSCWMCHGRYAAGDGPATAALQARVPSLLHVSSPDRHDALMAVIQNGRGAMPGFSYTITRPYSRRILAFLESLDEDTPAREAAAREAEQQVPEDVNGEGVPLRGFEGVE